MPSTFSGKEIEVYDQIPLGTELFKQLRPVTLKRFERHKKRHKFVRIALIFSGVSIFSVALIALSVMSSKEKLSPLEIWLPMLIGSAGPAVTLTLCTNHDRTPLELLFFGSGVEVDAGDFNPGSNWEEHIQRLDSMGVETRLSVQGFGPRAYARKNPVH